jgi:hypothetical protein
MCTQRLLVWLLSVGLITSSAVAQPAPLDGSTKRVTVDYRDVPLQRALKELFQGTDLTYSVDPALSNTLLTVRFRDLEFLIALRTLTRQAGATFYREGDTFFIQQRQSSTPAQLRSRVTLQLKDAPLSKAMEGLSRGTEFRIVIEPGTPETPVTMSLVNVDFPTALHTLVRVAKATYRHEGGRTYIIGPRAAPQPPTTPAAEAARSSPGIDWPPSRRISVDFHGVWFPVALEELLRGTGFEFAFGPEVAEYRVYLRLKEVPFEPALTILTSLAGATYRRERGIIVVTGLPAPHGAPAQPDDAVTPRLAGPKQSAQKVSLHLEQVPFRQALVYLFRAAREKHRIASGVPDPVVTVSVRDAPFHDVLRHVVALAGATSTREGATYVIRRP